MNKNPASCQRRLTSSPSGKKNLNSSLRWNNAMFWPVILTITLFAFPPSARALELSLPLKCTIGVDCFIQKYVDTDASEAWQDYQCNHLSNDAHQGTDFRLPDFTWLEKNVEVLAAADGKVTALRNDMEDVSVSELTPGSVQSKECGNGIVLDHGGGWKTQYCHMKKGSVRRQKGDRVKRGDALGFVGLSGETEFPHVHISVHKDNKIVDPFTGQHMGAGCGKEKEGKPLWDKATQKRVMHLEPTAILNTGITNRIPPVKEARHGKHHLTQTETNAPALVLWADIMGIKQGDIIQFEIIAPDNKVLHAHANEAGKSQAQLFIYTGKTNKNIGQWPEGEYRGKVTILRNEKPILYKEASIRIAKEQRKS